MTARTKLKKGQSERPLAERKSLRGSTLRRQQELPATKAGSEAFTGEYRAHLASTPIVDTAPLDEVDRFLAKVDGRPLETGNFLFVGGSGIAPTSFEEARERGQAYAVMPRTLSLEAWEAASILVHENQNLLPDLLTGQAPVAPTPVAPGASLTPEEARKATLAKAERHRPAALVSQRLRRVF